MSTDLERNWESFFWSGDYQLGWQALTTDEKSKEEVKGVLSLLKPKPGSRLLDWCGGWGRHGIRLAQKGFKVSLLDFTAAHLAQATATAHQLGVQIDTVLADFRQTPEEIQADYAINLFTSGIGYLTEEDDLQALFSLYRALKPGARVMIDTINHDYIVRRFNPSSTRLSPNGTLKIKEKRTFDAAQSRLKMETTYERDAVEAQTMTLSLHLYTATELASLLRRAGFVPIAFYGGFNGSPLTFKSKRLIVISQKPHYKNTQPTGY